jgi:glutathione S-transferase
MTTDFVPVLTYFQVRGKAESIRLLFAYKKKPLVEKHIVSSQEWKSQVKPYGQLPVMELENSQLLTQSMAILYYYAKQFEMLSTDALKCARQQELCESANDVQAEYNKYLSAPDAQSRQAVLDGLMVKVDRWLKRWESVISGNDFFVGENCSVADIQVFRVLADLVDYTEKQPEEMLENFPGLNKFYSLMSSQEGIKAYLASDRRFPIVRTEESKAAWVKLFTEMMYS